MSLSIIIDKSAFQSLNMNEVILLHNYYLPNITPILVLEIMGDLKKEFKSGCDSKVKVQEYSKKLLPYNSAVNEYFYSLLVEDLVNGIDKPDQRPFLTNCKIVKSSTNKLGFYVEESSQESALTRWRGGDFTGIEEELAGVWRTITTQKDLLENLKVQLKNKYEIKEKFQNLYELNEFINNMLGEESLQTQLLSFFVSEFNIDIELVSTIFLRWEQSEHKLLKDFAPYAFFCCKVKLLFELSLKYNLVGTRATNAVDLQYLYYIPFCKIFVTSDEFQKLLVPFLLDNNQKLIDGVEFKADLKKLASYRETLSERKDIERTKKEPPRILDSLTYKLWNEYFDWPNDRLQDNNDISYYKQKMDEFINSVETSDNIDNINGPDFFVRKRYYRPTDLCPCGSGKMFKVCCLPPDYFQKLKEKHAAKEPE
jgi:hypothetical protein